MFLGLSRHKHSVSRPSQTLERHLGSGPWLLGVFELQMREMREMQNPKGKGAGLRWPHTHWSSWGRIIAIPGGYVEGRRPAWSPPRGPDVIMLTVGPNTQPD